MTPQHLKRNNIILLICLVLFIAVFPILQSPRPIFRHIVLAAIVMSGIFSLDFKKRAQKLLIATGLAVIILLFISGSVEKHALDVLNYVMTFLFLLFIVVAIVRHISQKDEVDTAIMISSINGYLLLGVLWSLLLYAAYFFETSLLSRTPGIIFPGNVHPEFYDFLYFSFVTMTTLGYGDIIPVSDLSRSLTLLISISGQFYMTLLVAMLVGKYLGTKKDD